VHALALGVFYDTLPSKSVLRITPASVFLDRGAEGIEATKAHKQLKAATKAIRKGLPKNPDKLWGWLIEQDQKTLLAILAVCAVTSWTPCRSGMTRGLRSCRGARRRAEARHGRLVAADSGRVFRAGVEAAGARGRGRGRNEGGGGEPHAAQEGRALQGSREAAQRHKLAPGDLAGGLTRIKSATGSGSNPGAGFAVSMWREAAPASASARRQTIHARDSFAVAGVCHENRLAVVLVTEAGQSCMIWRALGFPVTDGDGYARF
jgi:hypothetical protein